MTNEKVKSKSPFNESLKRIKKNKAAVISAYFIFFMVIVAILAPVIAPFSFEAQDISRIQLPPNSVNWLGTDSLGRDMFSRVLYGARVSMAVGIYTAVVSLLMGTVYGAISGYLGGKVDAVMMRFIDILYAIPALILLVIMKVVIESMQTFSDPQFRALFSIFAALSIYGWITIARQVRGQVLQTKEMLFIEAARGLGVVDTSIVVKHILPNILGPVIVSLTFQIPANVIFESFLSFIGLGLQPPYSSWGVLANEGWRSLRTYPHLIIAPGTAIFFTMLAFNLFGDGLRDAFDPKMK